MAVLAALVAAPYLVPARFSTLPLPGGKEVSFRLLTAAADKGAAGREAARAAEATEPEGPVGVGDVVLPATVDEQEDTAPPAVAAPRFLEQKDTGALPTAQDAREMLIDASGQSLAPLFAALAQVEAKQPGASARISYYGDSIVAFDMVTSTLRRRLQDRFGDAGRGFVLPVNPWSGYYQDDVSRFASSGWVVSRLVGPLAPDGLYGLGGVSFRGEERALAIIATARRGNYGRNTSRFVVSYAAQPGGGELSLKVDEDKPKVISTAAPQLETRAEEVRAADGPHRLELRTSKGPVRVFGVELLRDTPGVTVDALGIIGARLWQLEQANEAQWAGEVARVHPAMVVLAFGINDVSDGVRGIKAYETHEQAARRVIKRLRDAAPWAACLIAGPLDRGAGMRDPYTNRDIANRINKTLRAISAEMGCAFWDIFTLMGGAGGMGEWAKKGLGSADYMHPSPRGATLLGDLLSDELVRRYELFAAAAQKPP